MLLFAAVTFIHVAQAAMHCGYHVIVCPCYFLPVLRKTQCIAALPRYCLPLLLFTRVAQDAMHCGSTTLLFAAVTFTRVAQDATHCVST